MKDEDFNYLRGLGYTITKKTFHDVSIKGKPVVSIFIEDKYIQFHDEYTQIAWGVPELRELLNKLERLGFRNNHS